MINHEYHEFNDLDLENVTVFLILLRLMSHFEPLFCHGGQTVLRIPVVIQYEQTTLSSGFHREKKNRANIPFAATKTEHREDFHIIT
jgi:hypothetical protein